MVFPRPVRILAPLLVLLFCSCGAPEKEEERFAQKPLVRFDLSQIRKRGFITALVDNNSVSYFIYKGNSMGYEYELLKRLADELHVSLRIRLIVNIEEAIDLLNKGEGDVIAFPLTVTEERKQYMTFTKTHFVTSEVLIQKKSSGLTDSSQLAEQELIRNPAQLIGKDVYVKKGSSFKSRLQSLSAQVGGTINIIEDNDDEETEALIRKVALGEIKYTVNDQIFAAVNATYYPDLDIETEISESQQIAWAMRKNSPELLAATNRWLSKIKRQGTFRIIYKKYFNSPRTSLIRMNSDFSSISGGSLSRYDDQIKAGAELIGWDWRLLAALIYQESHFDPRAESWAGATGLMQLMPATLKQYRVHDVYNPDQNMNAGVRFLKYLDKLWSRTVKDSTERAKFVLASYNVGLSHVVDARNLARKYGKNPKLWEDHVEFYLLKKSNPKYYRDPVVRAGYCRCTGPVVYVKEVLQRYEEYRAHFNE